ncbi:MAG: hypothetical protein AAF297_10355 [Planctomycetota bacterium]
MHTIWVMAALAVVTTSGCSVLGPIHVGGGGAGTQTAEAPPTAPVGEPGGDRPSDPPKSDPPPSAEPPGSEPIATAAGEPIGGQQRVWMWFNPGTTSSDIDGQRGIGLDRGYRVLKEGGWGAWIDQRLKPLGHPPVVLRAPFGTSRWETRSGKPVSFFRYEDAIDVQRDPQWAWIASETGFVQPWARYPGPVAFHVGTADDRVLTDEELRLGARPFVRVQEMRERLGNTEPVYVVLDHSMYFGDTVDPNANNAMSRRELLQTSMAVTLLENAGIEVLTEAVPDRSWPSAEYWVSRGVAFRPHLSKDRRKLKPVPLERFEGLVLAWMLPADFRREGETAQDHRRRVIEATREYGNVAVPMHLVGGGDGWRELVRAVGRERFGGE